MSSRSPAARSIARPSAGRRFATRLRRSILSPPTRKRPLAPRVSVCVCVWTEIISCVFRVKPPFTNFPGEEPGRKSFDTFSAEWNLRFQIPPAKCGRKTFDSFSEWNLCFRIPPAKCGRAIVAHKSSCKSRISSEKNLRDAQISRAKPSRKKSRYWGRCESLVVN